MPKAPAVYGWMKAGLWGRGMTKTAPDQVKVMAGTLEGVVDVVTTIDGDFEVWVGPHPLRSKDKGLRMMIFKGNIKELRYADSGVHAVPDQGGGGHDQGTD